jgi:hypothetical protein
LNKTRELTRRAFQVWGDVTPLTFTEVCKNCKSDIRIDFARHIHDNEGPEDVRLFKLKNLQKLHLEIYFYLGF